MLNSLKIKLRTLLLSRKQKSAPVFVNPYAPIVPVPTSKINPYVTEYGVVKKKPIGEVIVDKFRKETQLSTCTQDETVVKEPTFLQDMNEMFIRDITSIAFKFRSPIKKKERVMTSNEIRRACENTKW